MKQRILIMAGGTGGHVFPALAIADKLTEQGVDVHWLGTAKGIEARLVPAHDYPLHFVHISGVRRNGVLRKLLAPFFILRAIFESYRLIKQIGPDVVLGMGGFASGPGGIAARLLRKPLVIHEQNSAAGMTNRILRRFAQRVMAAFPGSFIGSGVIETGNPVRESLKNLPSPDERYRHRSGPLRLLILGGSQGALSINQLMPHALAALPEAMRPEVWHQCGGAHAEETAALYNRLQVGAKVISFIEEMEKAYAWADVVIARAGALTVAELAAVGVASILIPYPYAVDDHQTKNAWYLSDNGAAILVPQAEFTTARVVSLWMQWETERDLLWDMARRAYALAKPDATGQVAGHCLEVMHESRI